MSNYIALIRKEIKSDYGVDFPDFPGCITAGATLDEAKNMAGEALAAHVELMNELGEILPEASSLERIMSDKSNRDTVAFLVSVPIKSRSIRFNATMDDKLLQAIDNRLPE